MFEVIFCRLLRSPFAWSAGFEVSIPQSITCLLHANYSCHRNTHSVILVQRQFSSNPPLMGVILALAFTGFCILRLLGHLEVRSRLYGIPTQDGHVAWTDAGTISRISLTDVIALLPPCQHAVSESRTVSPLMSSFERLSCHLS